MSIFGDFFKKEAPLLGMQGSGGGLGFLAGRGGPKVSATGGTKTTVGAYTIHTFSYPTTDNFVVDKGGEVDILVVAGGGGGGGGGPAQWQGGGGGAGGYAYVTEYTVVPGTTYPIAVGNGGNGGSPGTRGTGGGNSSFYPSGPTTSSIFCQGGGGGGAGNQNTSGNAPGNPGGSGGGSGAHLTSETTPGGSAVQPAQNPGFSNGTFVQYGYPGGVENGGSGDGTGGGGGGAGGPGQSSPGGSANGQGGPGVPNTINGTDVTYAAGGAGNGYPYPGTWPTAISTAAGAGGNSGSPDGPASVTGRPGIVIVRYLT
jgi:hypothetical protein